MGRIKKKGTSGAAKNYITRTKAVKKLQISLPDFRRLCIFKGIYPREPRNKKKVSKGSTAATTFYYTKDIQYLLHEPLLNKFREHKSVAKKIGRALGRGEAGDAARLEKTLIPKIKLDHIIKERYPTFVDALRDLDDALSMLFLFANLPSHEHVPAKTIALCQRLCLEFEHYVIASHSLRRSFLSIKGIYYQATIQGQDIMWLVPYRFVQRTGGDIDFRIMGTFVEFYTTLLGFVNFRLYTSLGLVYPPKFDAKSDEHGGELAAFRLEGKGLMNGDSEMSDEEPKQITSTEAQAEVDRIAAQAAAEQQEEETEAPAQTEEEENTDKIDTFEVAAQDGDVLPQPQASNAEIASLFAPFTFYLSRETPRAPLEFILKAFGCKRVGWDGILGDGAFTTNESDPAITHQIVDRPALPTGALPAAPKAAEKIEGAKAQWPHSTMPGRTYIQPQWVWDCINQGKLLRPDLYAPGAELPPHLSPWVKAKKGEYDPNLPLAAQELEGEAEEFEDEEDVEDEEEDSDVEMDGAKETNGADAIAGREGSVEAGEGMDVASGNSDSDEESDSDAGAEAFDGFEDESDAESDISEGEAARRQQQRELEAEAKGITLEKPVQTKKDKNAAIRKAAEKKRKLEAEEKERQKMMLPRRKRKLLKRIEHGEEKRDKESEALRKKRRKVEKAKAAANAV